MKIGLYFGSFNPIHIGHMAIANYIVEYTDLDELWFVVSPHNPLKEKKTLLDDHARLDLVQLAVKDDPRFKACDIEFRLPQPSYTIHTLAYLTEKYPKNEFALIMGSDGLRTFHKWKSADIIKKGYDRYIYPRNTEDLLNKDENLIVVDAPKIEISSTFIRNAIKHNKDIRHFLPNQVYNAIDKFGYYI